MNIDNYLQDIIDFNNLEIYPQGQRSEQLFSLHVTVIRP